MCLFWLTLQQRLLISDNHVHVKKLVEVKKHVIQETAKETSNISPEVWKRLMENAIWKTYSDAYDRGLLWQL